MNPSMSLVYLPPHLERSQPFPRVGHQLSSPDNSQEMSWPPPYSYARGTVSNASDDQQLYPAMNRLPTSYNMPFYPSTQYMERESSQSQCTLQSNTPFSHDAGLDLSNRPAVPRRRTREDSDSASVSGSAPYGSTDSNQVCMRKWILLGLFTLITFLSFYSGRWSSSQLCFPICAHIVSPRHDPRVEPRRFCCHAFKCSFDA